jgi:pimeloyl-ACP methyl ester carboxylesterase
MESIDLPQGRLHYRVAGPEDAKGPPVVFIHPVLCDGALWSPVAERLAAEGIRSYAPDWPLGSHRIALASDADRSPRGIAQMVSDFLAALELQQVTLVGNDTGGAITQYVLDAGEARVARAVVMNCDAFDTFPPFPFNAILGLMKLDWLAHIIAIQMQWTPLRHSWLGFGLLARNRPADLTRSWLEPIRIDDGVRADLVHLLRNVRPAELKTVTPRMSVVTKPVIVLWGMADRVFKPALGRRLAAAFANAEFIEVPNARTFLALDAPDAVAAAIASVAARVS